MRFYLLVNASQSVIVSSDVSLQTGSTTRQQSTGAVALITVLQECEVRATLGVTNEEIRIQRYGSGQGRTAGRRTRSEYM